MKKFLLPMVTLLLTLLFLLPTISSAQLEDGTYSLDYQVNKPNDASASIANDYFAKPAKLIVDNGSLKVQLTIKNSAWITEFNGPHGGNKVVSSDKTKDTRLVEFDVTDINSPTVVKMKVDIEDINYHHVYSVDFAWNASSVKLIEAAKKEEPAKKEVKTETKTEAKVETKTAAKQETGATTAKTTETAAVANSKEKTKTAEKSATVTTTEEKQATEEKQMAETVADSTEVEKQEVESEQVVVEETPAETTIEENLTEVVAQSEQAIEKAVQADEENSNALLYTLIVLALVVIVGIIIFARKKTAANKAA